MKISIVVPVFNVDQYLSHCIKSVINQLYSDWELLLVDDGSTDNSGKICDEYAILDSRIQVFHKENGGVSSARNLALANCTGDWVVFVDGDDTIVPYMLQELDNNISEHPDVGLFSWGYNRIVDSRINVVCFRESLLTAKQLYETSFHEGICFYAFKRCRLQEWNISFPVSITHSEDQCFTCKYLMHNPLCYSIDRAYYNYYYRATSACGQPLSLKTIENNLKVAKNLAEYSFKGSSIDKRLSRIMVTQLFHNYIGYLLRLTDYDHRLAQQNYRFYYKDVVKIMPSFLRTIRYILCFFSLDSYLYLLKRSNHGKVYR